MTKALFAVFAISTGMVGNGLGQGYTYTLSTGASNVEASITLDTPYSPASGGTVNDILNLWGQVPLPNGEIVGFSYSPMGIWEPDESFSVSSLTWNPEGISSLSISYVPDSPLYENWSIGGGTISGFDPDQGFLGFPPYYESVSGYGGTWEPAFTLVPEPGTVSLLIAGMCGFWFGRRFVATGGC